MKRASPAEFDLAAEKTYFAKPVTEVAPYAWLDTDMRLWIGGYPDSLDGKSILDLGAGEGLHGVLVCERYEPKRFVALELVRERLLAAATKAGDLPALSLVSGNAYSLPHPDGTFDVVLGNGALHHLPDTAAVAAEIARVLKPGGYYYGREPNFSNPLVRRRVLNEHDASPNEFAIYPEEIRAAFGKCGFDVQIGYFWRRVPWLRNRILSVSQRVAAQLR